MGVSPPTKTGGHDEYVSRVGASMAFLGHGIGFGIFAFTLALVGLEVVLNPIFLFAQAEQSGGDIGNPITSLSWWLIVLITFATTGIQYALLQPGGARDGI